MTYSASGSNYVVDEYGEVVPRLFDAELSPMHRRVPQPQLVVYDSEQQISKLQLYHSRLNQLEHDSGTLVIHIDGACRNNGTLAARASWGVYVGPGSRYNTKGLLSSELISQSSSRAEIEALAGSLDVARSITADDFSLNDVKIASDSQYLVKALSMWISGWIEAGGVRSNGQPVAHFDRLREIHEMLDEMEFGDNGGVSVQLWHVDREMNREADALANQALDQALGA
ncbi:hypothetical protein CHU98_g8503 [Xylaria longipes]|nr:hypothetical protein CHU98_g8503 [Xylaria longipes]